MNKHEFYELLIVFILFTVCWLDGHDSAQDAAVALELALLKAQGGNAIAPIVPWGDEPVPKCTVFEMMIQVRYSGYLSDFALMIDEYM